MDITLRPYQKAMQREVYDHIRSGQNRILAVVIMGAGKTFTAAAIIADAVSKGHRCLFLVKLNVLIDQTLEALREYGLSATALQGERVVDPDATVVVASVQTIRARTSRGQTLDSLLGRPRLVIADEAHLVAFDRTYKAVEGHSLAYGGVLLGLTATPWRLSQKEFLGQRFDALVVGPQPPEVIKLGNALPCRGFSIVGALDPDTLQVRQGEYVDADIAAQATRPEALEHIVNEWQRLCSDRPTMMVGATIEQALLTAQAFNAEGITAETIIGSTSNADRKAIFKRVQSGETKIICSVGCLTAGFNLPCLSAILYVRATKSKALFHQTAGRGSRPHPGKTEYFLLDFGDNIKRHKNPMWEQDYSIGPKPEIPPLPIITKTCPECKAELNRLVRICPHCGHVFDVARNTKEEDDLILAELNEVIDKKAFSYLRDERRANYAADLSPDKAQEDFYIRYGYIPPGDWMKGACLTLRSNKKTRREYLEYLQRHCRRPEGSSQRDSWFRYHWAWEFGQGPSYLDPEAGVRKWQEIFGLGTGAFWDDIKAAYQQAAQDAGNDDEAIEALNTALEDAREEQEQERWIPKVGEEIWIHDDCRDPQTGLEHLLRAPQKILMGDEGRTGLSTIHRLHAPHQASLTGRFSMVQKKSSKKSSPFREK